MQTWGTLAERTTAGPYRARCRSRWPECLQTGERFNPGHALAGPSCCKGSPSLVQQAHRDFARKRSPSPGRPCAAYLPRLPWRWVPTLDSCAISSQVMSTPEPQWYMKCAGSRNIRLPTCSGSSSADTSIIGKLIKARCSTSRPCSAVRGTVRKSACIASRLCSRHNSKA